jgi:hypothetical protein
VHRNVSVCKCERIADKARAFLRLFLMTIYSHSLFVVKLFFLCDVCQESVAVCAKLVRNINI